MSRLYETWTRMEEMAAKANRADAFRQDYFDRETVIYRQLLKEIADKSVFSGTVQEMADHYNTDPVFMSVVLDGINTSLKEPLDIESLEEDTPVAWEIEPEKLYYNMNNAKAPWLYNLAEWDEILTPERRREITREWRLSGQARAESKPGRNDPCPCGSGKKYKKCCMLKENA